MEIYGSPTAVAVIVVNLQTTQSVWLQHFFNYFPHFWTMMSHIFQILSRPTQPFPTAFVRISLQTPALSSTWLWGRGFGTGFSGAGQLLRIELQFNVKCRGSCAIYRSNRTSMIRVADFAILDNSADNTWCYIIYCTRKHDNNISIPMRWRLYHAVRNNATIK